MFGPITPITADHIDEIIAKEKRMKKKPKIYWAAYKGNDLYTDINGCPWIYKRKKDCWMSARKVRIVEIKKRRKR